MSEQAFHTFSIRMDRGHLSKLDDLATSTERSRGAVIRHLLDLATLDAVPVVRLAGPAGAVHDGARRQDLAGAGVANG